MAEAGGSSLILEVSELLSRIFCFGNIELVERLILLPLGFFLLFC